MLRNVCTPKSYENENSCFKCNYLDGKEKLTTYSRQNFPKNIQKRLES